MHRWIMGKETEMRLPQWRSQIVNALFDKCTEENIDILFEADVEEIDFSNNFLIEKTKGKISFDMCIGSDRIYNATRRFISEEHPEFQAHLFDLEFIDMWHAYRLLATESLSKALGSGKDTLRMFSIHKILRSFPHKCRTLKMKS